MRCGALVIAAVLAASAACLTPMPKPGTPGTGALSFRLVWSGVADLDLSVREPSGETIGFGRRASTTGGVLDIDCNARPDVMCQNPMENIYWPGNHPPLGLFIVHVRLTNTHGDPPPIAFALVVRRGGRVVESTDGALARFGDSWRVFHLETGH